MSNRSLLVGVVALALVAGACSQSSDTDGADGTSKGAGPTTFPVPSDGPVLDVRESGVDPALAAELEAALVEEMECYGVPGSAVSVDFGDGGARWSATAGVADIESGTPMSDDLQWPIRSITKSFAVMLLLQLVDEGLVSLDDTVDQWVERIPNGDSVTLGQLADMTSGVPDYTGESFVEDFTADPSAAFSRGQLLDYVREGEPSAEPGAERRYINSSTVLLGEVLEQVTGESFAELVVQHLGRPYGMGDTVYPETVEGFTGEHPTGYQPEGDGLAVPPTNFTVFDTAGAMISTLGDLEVWAHLLGRGESLEAATDQQRFEASPLVEGPEYDRYGTGIGELEGWWGHTGEGFGYTTLVMFDPQTSAGVVVLMNASDLAAHVPTKLFRRIAGILAGSEKAASCGGGGQVGAGGQVGSGQGGDDQDQGGEDQGGGGDDQGGGGDDQGGGSGGQGQGGQ